MLVSSEKVKAALSGPEVHEGWERTYQSDKNGQFCRLAHDWLFTAFDFSCDARLLDIGCGTGHHSVRFARRGYHAVACDFSLDRLLFTRDNAAASGARVNVCGQDITSLGFRDSSFDGVLCWGVLMHVPEVENAMAELMRVTKPRGKIILYEDNLWSLDTLIRTLGVAVKMALGSASTRRLAMTPYGLESWVRTPVANIVIRQSRIRALVGFFERGGCRLLAHRPGQFTELYRFCPDTMLASALQSFDNFWFSRIRSPRLAYGSLLVFERPS
jgi:SAM-dependent methyltransferase